MKLLRFSLALVAVLVVGLLSLRLLFPLPDRLEVAVSTSLPMSRDTRIGAAVLPAVVANPGKSGVGLLAAGAEAFAACEVLARAAERTLDVQYYIWQADTTGYLLLDEVRAAAERGVRVRLLVDDNGITGLDGPLRALDDLPMKEVRLFNPFTLRLRNCCPSDLTSFA